jgi:hypothetical protein
MRYAPAWRPDRSRVVGSVVGQLHSTRRRRRRWWPFSASRAVALPPTGHATVIGRTASMFGIAKAVTASALILALGGALFVVQPSGRHGGGPSGAETEPVAPTWITGSITHAPGCRRPAATEDGAVTHRWNIVCELQTWTASDPRFTGRTSLRVNEDHVQIDEGTAVVGTSAYHVTTEGGTWTCRFNWVYPEFVEMVAGDTLMCVGAGGYEGLSAVLYQQVDPSNSLGETFVGLLFSGDVPPVPDPPAAE